MTSQWSSGISKVIFGLSALAIVLSMAACGQARAAAPSNSAPATGNAAQATSPAAVPRQGAVLQPAPAASTLGGELTIAPFPVKVMQETKLQLKLLDKDGKPITGAKVSFDLTMPSMMMPTNQTPATEGPNGIYSASVFFSMGGGWNVNCLVSRGGQNDRVVFSFEIQ